MKKDVTRYWCDICEVEIVNYPELRWLKTGGTGVGCTMDFEHVCTDCNDFIEKAVNKRRRSPRCNFGS